MLVELDVSALGVIDELSLVLEPGLTALTGETGAGKTLVVEALSLLLGGRADSLLVREGATEARVEARLDTADGEVVVARAIAREGRSRAYLDGRMSTVQSLEEVAGGLVELYAQHAHQSLFQRSQQREALDRFAGVDLAEVRARRAELAALERELAALGGDERQRARELDLLSFELAEIDAAAVRELDEEERLREEEEALAGVLERRAATERAYAAITDDETGIGVVAGGALRGLEEAGLADECTERLRALLAEANELARDLRRAAEALEEDPERLEAIRARRQVLRDLMRKYGEDLRAVLATRDELAGRIEELAATEERRAELEARRAELVAEQARDFEAIAAQRRLAAPSLARAVEEHLGELGMPRARLEVRVDGDGPADDVEFLLAANPGEPPQPLARVASGGELARTMLALRLVLTSAPPTLVFDEVDAGIGGTAALAVGRALAALARDHQVLVVTHLAQVAAFAHQQVVVEKSEVGGRTVTSCRKVEGEDRIVELSRMLSGHPNSSAARAHASELLDAASAPP